MFFSMPQTVQREILAGLLVGMVNFLIGFGATLVAYADPSKNDVAEVESVAIAGSASLFTAIAGTALFGYLGEKHGRKKSLMTSFVISTIGGAIFFIFKTDMALYISRAISGLSAGSRPTVILYVSETSHATRRGTVLSSLVMISIFGILLTYLCQYFLTIQTVAGIAALISAAGFVGMSFLPETKYWYLTQNNRKKAKESILWFDSSKSDEDIEKELNEIKVGKKDGGHTNVFQVLRESHHLKQFLIATFLFLCRTGCGREPMATYANDFYAHLGLVFNSRILTLLQAFIEFGVSIVATVAIGNFKRRTLLYSVVSILIPSLCILLITHNFSTFSNKYVPWLSPAFAIVYASSCTAFLFPLVTVVAVEVISRSNEYRNIIYSISYSIMTLSRGIFTAIFPFLLNGFDMNVTLSVFLISNLLLLMMIKFFVTETANKALHDCAGDNKKEGETKTEQSSA